MQIGGDLDVGILMYKLSNECISQKLYPEMVYHAAFSGEFLPSM